MLDCQGHLKSPGELTKTKMQPTAAKYFAFQVQKFHAKVFSDYFCIKMARDLYHYIVKEALIRDDWDITHDPYPLQNWNPDWEIDLGAEKMIAAERGVQKIAVEIKSFTADSFAYEFHRVLGQFMNYQAGLEIFEPERVLYIAVPESVFLTEFQRKGIQVSLQRYHVRIVVFDPFTKTILEWIS